MTIAIISHPDCVLHEVGQGHPERPDRIQAIQAGLKIYPFKSAVTHFAAPLVAFEQLYRVHDKQYVDWIISIAPKSGLIGIDEDTWMNPHTLKAARRAAGSVPFAVDLVMHNKAKVAFCNIRPPGHHAEYEKAMGFCFFNNVAVGVRYAMDHYGIERVAIVDFDVHHGNGTQSIFQQEEQVLYCSSFQHPFYPGYEPEMDSEHILSVPLRAGTKGDVFREKVEGAWFEKIAAFQPQLIFFSAGFDAHQSDPIGQLKLTTEDYVWLTQRIAKIAQVHGEGRLISVLEGGYNLEALAECVPAHVNAML